MSRLLLAMSRLSLPMLLAAVVFVVALSVRVAGTDTLQDEHGNAAPMSADAWYYLDRTVASYRGLVGAGPVLPDWEPGLSCPTGTAPPWPHGLNVAVALAARAVLGGDAEPEAIRTLAAGVPPLLGALACVLLALFGASLFNPLVGLLAGLLLALLPIHVWNTAWSTLDHHVLAPIVPLLAVWAIRAATETNKARWWVAAGVVLGLSHWGWTEAWFWQAAVVGVGLIHALFGAPMRSRATNLRGVAAMAMVAAIVALPGILTAPYFVHGRVAPHAPSRFTLWANAGVAAAALGSLFCRKHGPVAVLAAAVACAVATVAAALLDPGMREAFAATAGFAGRTGMVSLIDESKPLLARSFPQPLLLLSGAILVAPALPLSWRRAAPSDRWLLGTLYAVSLLLALLQSRFALVFAVPFCLALATTLLGGPWMADTTRGRLLRTLAAVGAATVLFSLATRSYSNPERGLRHDFMKQIAARIGPPPADADRRCLLAPWNLGHELLLIAKQPVVAHNYTEHEDRAAIVDADRFLFGQWHNAAGILAKRKVRMVWIEARGHADIVAHQAEIGADAATDLRSTAWLRLLLGDRQAARELGLQRTWASPMRVVVRPGGPGTPEITVPRDQLYVVPAAMPVRTPAAASLPAGP